MSRILRLYGLRNMEGLNKVLKTGQTVQYGSYADDGYYEKGIAKAYVDLTTGQFSGTTNITLNGKTEEKSNNCVYDVNTGLMWSKTESATLGPNDDGTIPWTTNANGEGIFAYVAAANAANFAGYSDWRVPNINEIDSLVIYAVPVTKYASNLSYTYTWRWTSTTVPDNTDNAILSVIGNDGHSTTVKTGTEKVCLVRG